MKYREHVIWPMKWYKHPRKTINDLISIFQVDEKTILDWIVDALQT